MEVYDTLHALENMGYIKLVSYENATEAEAAEGRWYLEQQDADPDAFTSDAIGEELYAHLTAKGRSALAAQGGG